MNALHSREDQQREPSGERTASGRPLLAKKMSGDDEWGDDVIQAAETDEEGSDAGYEYSDGEGGGDA